MSDCLSDDSVGQMIGIFLGSDTGLCWHLDMIWSVHSLKGSYAVLQGVRVKVVRPLNGGDVGKLIKSQEPVLGRDDHCLTELDTLKQRIIKQHYPTHLAPSAQG